MLVLFRHGRGRSSTYALKGHPGIDIPLKESDDCRMGLLLRA